MSKELVCKKDKIKCHNIKNNTTRIDFTNIIRENIKEHIPNWPRIPDHAYSISITVGSGTGKPNALLNLISLQPNIDKMYLYDKDPYELKYQFLISKSKDIGWKRCKDSIAFIEYSNHKDDIYKNTEEYSLNKEPKTVIVFDDMIADILSNKSLQ